MKNGSKGLSLIGKDRIGLGQFEEGEAGGPQSHREVVVERRRDSEMPCIVPDIVDPDVLGNPARSRY